jgi:hypothetical protein
VTGVVEPNELTFSALDGLAFAASRGRLGSDVPRYVVADLGPIIEMVQLARSGLLPSPTSAPWLHLNGSEGLLQAALSGDDCWESSQSSQTGIIKCEMKQSTPKRWTSFGVEAHKAGLSAGFSTQTVSRLIGAMGEIVDNVMEHSQAASTGVVAVGSNPGSFEFVVSDAGVGTLASLRSNPEYAYLRDEGDALQCALTAGESRFGKAAKRGTGFSQLFKSLATLNASLRFRSGDHALIMAGESPTLVNAHVAKKPRAAGFLTSVRCKTTAGPAAMKLNN